MLGCRRTRPVLRDHKTPYLSELAPYSAQQLSSSMSFRKEVATSLMDSVIVGKTCTVSMMSSIVSLYLTARTASWIRSAAVLLSALVGGVTGRSHLRVPRRGYSWRIGQTR